MKVLLCGLFFILLAWAAHADVSPDGHQDSLVRQLGTASVNWTSGRIVAGGSSAFKAEGKDIGHKVHLAERQARVKATRNLFDALGQMKLNSSSTFGELWIAAPEIRQNVSSMVHQAVVVDKAQTAGAYHLVEVFLLLDLWDEHTRLFMPVALFQAPETEGFLGEGLQLPGDCVIYMDTDGLDLNPAVIPSIIDEQGTLVFRASILGSAKNSGNSRVSYVRSFRDSVMFRPGGQGQTTWIRAGRASGKNSSDIQLDKEGAEKFRQVISSTNDGCTVKIILQ